MKICENLRQSVLQAAIQGKLVEQRPEEGTGEELYQQIQAEKQKLIKAGKFKKEKPLSEITEDEIPFEIPDSWKWVKLGNICSICTGKKDANFGSSIGNYFFFTCAKEPIRCNSFSFSGESILMAGNGDIGNISYYFGEFEAYQRTYVLQPYMEFTYLKYVLYHLSYNWVPYNNDKMFGTAIPYIKLGNVQNYLVALPSLAEQKRIVAKIDELMAKIDDLEKTENELETLKKDFPGDMKASILQAAMQGRLTEQLASDSNVDDLIENIEIYTKRKISIIENDEVPENWRTVKISDVSSLFTGNSISQNVKATKYTGLTEGYDYIGTKDVGFNHQIAYDNGVKIPYDEPNFRYAEKGDTLFCIEGGSAGKKIAISDKKVCFGNKLCAFHTININNKFLYYYLQSPLFLNYFTNNLSGIIGGVSINKIKQLSIPVPPIEEQQRIVDKLDQLLPLCEILQERVE